MNRSDDRSSGLATPFSGLGKAIRFLRQRRGLTQEELAAEASVSASMLSGYENSRHAPEIATLDRILMALGAGTRDLCWALDAVRGGGFEGREHPSGERLARELLGKLVDTGLIDEDALPRIVGVSESD